MPELKAEDTLMEAVVILHGTAKPSEDSVTYWDLSKQGASDQTQTIELHSLLALSISKFEAIEQLRKNDLELQNLKGISSFSEKVRFDKEDVNNLVNFINELSADANDVKQSGAEFYLEKLKLISICARLLTRAVGHELVFNYKPENFDG